MMQWGLGSLKSSSDCFHWWKSRNKNWTWMSWFLRNLSLTRNRDSKMLFLYTEEFDQALSRPIKFLALHSNPLLSAGRVTPRFHGSPTTETQIKMSTKIGSQGDTLWSQTPCLHWEVCKHVSFQEAFYWWVPSVWQSRHSHRRERHLCELRNIFGALRHL